MKLKTILISGIIIFVVLLIGFNFKSNDETQGKYDFFAKCLSDNKVVMYGAYWCPHCTKQKEMFGSSWKYVTYAECSLPGATGQTEICKQAEIKGYPTWEFLDNKKVEGELSFEKISQYSNCTLPSL